MKKKLSKIYRLFAPCIPVKGYCRSIIADINRHKIFLIPNSLYEIIEQNKNNTLFQILREFKKEDKPILIEYFNFLELNEMIFPLEEFEIKRFPKLPLQWDFPSLCSNALIDINEFSTYDVYRTLSELSKINCFHLQIRFFKFIDYTELTEIIQYANELSFRSIQLMMNYNDNIDEDLLRECMVKYWKLAKIEVYNAPFEKIIPLLGLITMIIYYKEKLKSTDQCGCVDEKYFSIEMKHFTESQHFNTCLNRKISIDKNGEIKNCPSMEHAFGNITETNLSDIIENSEFRKLWSIRKDIIDVCKDCEFRYICTDCRCFIQNPDDIFSQPSKCRYNPYLAKWENEDGFISVENWRKTHLHWEKKARRKILVKNPLSII